jgi:hypothetical protein
MEYWPGIHAQINKQATLVRQPDGLLIETGRVASRIVS